MADRLESVRQKLGRAREHREAFSRLGTEWGEEILRPWPVSYDPENDEFTLALGKVPTPKPALALVLGDAIHNYRCALDHLAFQLVKHPDRAPREQPTPDDEIQFPIARFPQDFSTRTIKGAADRAKDRIRAMQPFNPSWESLLVLNKLDSREKHQTLQIVADTIAGVGFLTNEVLAETWLIRPGTHVKDGEPLARWKFRPGADRQADIGPFVGMGFEFSGGIAAGAQVPGTLDRIEFTVEQVVTTLAPYVAA